MLNNLNTSIITPLSPKKQKQYDSRFFQNEFPNEISPEFLNIKKKTIKKYINSNITPDNESSNFLLFTPADIRHNNSIPETLNSTYNIVNSDLDNPNYGLNSINNNKSYSVDTSSSIETTNIENNVYLKNNNNTNIINAMLNDSSIHSPSNLFNAFNENPNSYLNYNLIPNENSNIINTNINTIYNKNDNLMELGRNYNVNPNIINQETFKYQNNSYLSSLYSNATGLSNVMNLDISSSSININHTEEEVDNSMKRKRKIEIYEKDNNSANSINNSNPIKTTKKLKLNIKFNTVDETCRLINRINEPSAIDNKLQFYNNDNPTFENKYENNENNKRKFYL